MTYWCVLGARLAKSHSSSRFTPQSPGVSALAFTVKFPMVSLLVLNLDDVQVSRNSSFRSLAMGFIDYLVAKTFVWVDHPLPAKPCIQRHCFTTPGMPEKVDGLHLSLLGNLFLTSLIRNTKGVQMKRNRRQRWLSRLLVLSFLRFSQFQIS